ncbi:MAG: CAS/CSE protein, partial [Monoraphidium minutum]
KSRTPRFTHGFGVFLSLFICSAGPQAVVSSMDAVQPGIFGMVARQVWLPSWPGIDGGDDSKLLTVAAAKCLTECPPVFSDQPLWREIKGALDGRMQGGADGAAGGGGGGVSADDLLLDEEQLPGGGYAAAYAKLANADAPERPVLADIPDPRQYAAASIASFMQRAGGA